MTQLEEELQQAKMTITQLKDTTLRQDMILQQYAEEVIVFCLRTVSKSEAGKEAVAPSWYRGMGKEQCRESIQNCV